MRDVTRESRPHYVESGDPIIVGHPALVPWLYAERHVRSFFSLSFFPIELKWFTADDAGPKARPDGVPSSDRALKISTNAYPPRVTYIWYDPCTYAVDAF